MNMKERVKIGSMFLLIIAMSILLIYKKEWIIMSIFYAVMILIYFVINQNNKRWSMEFEAISETLELLLQKKDFPHTVSNADTLYAKIMAQLQRIDEITRANQKILEDEKDGIKRLLAEISHQLRTPLANMETYLALLNDDMATIEEKQSYLKSIENAEKKISFLMEKFILAARLENQVIQIHKCDLDLKETVAEAIFQVYRKAEKKKIYIEISEQDNMDKTVSHDKNWICESIYNLLDNSIKYSPNNSKIIVAMKNNEMFTEISVEDEGIGINAGEENRIFQLYHRGNNVSEQEGYGIGLYLTRQIVKKHGGYMRVKRKNQGLIVSIFLPKTGA